MKSAISVLCSLILLFSLSCNRNGDNAEKEKNKKMEEIKQTPPDSLFVVELDESVDRIALDAHYARFPERWQLAAAYLGRTDVATLPVGRTDLSEDVYVTVSEYTTKNPEDALYESHREYIDLQYVVSGSEYIGVTHSDELPVAAPYDGRKDIAFYQPVPGGERLADSRHLFIFFPQDKHRPCIKNGRNATVKKIVVKLKMNN